MSFLKIKCFLSKPIHRPGGTKSEPVPIFIFFNVNAQERKTLKRALISQQKWKEKAQERKKGLRLLQLKIRDLERSRMQWKEKFFKMREEYKDKKKEVKNTDIKPSTASDKQATADVKKK